MSASMVRNTHSILDAAGERRELTLFQSTLLNFITHSNFINLRHLYSTTTSSIIAKALDWYSAVMGSTSVFAVNFRCNHVYVFCFSWYVIFDIGK